MINKNWFKILNTMAELGGGECLSLIRSLYENKENNIDIIGKLYLSTRGVSGSNNRFDLMPCVGCHSSCHELMVAFAELGFESKKVHDKYGFRSLMALLYPYWYQCEQNQTNIIFTSNFDRQKFNEFYLETFKEFERRGKKVVVIEVCEDDFYVQYENLVKIF
jgi:hypothetical protein